jgi:hypothetical protein
MGALMVAGGQPLPQWDIYWLDVGRTKAALKALASAVRSESDWSESGRFEHWDIIVIWNNSQNSAEPVIEGMRKAAKQLWNETGDEH